MQMPASDRTQRHFGRPEAVLTDQTFITIHQVPQGNAQLVERNSTLEQWCECCATFDSFL